MSAEPPTIGGLLRPLDQKKQVEETSDKYLQFFDETNEQDQDENRKDNVSAMVNQYYDMATDFYEYGWGESFHFGDRKEYESHQQSLLRNEYRMALKLGLSAEDTALDIGCGVGGPARHIAEFSRARVVGLNNNEYQVMRANLLTKAAGMEHLCRFVKGDFCHAPFESESFNKVYAFEAPCHAGRLANVFGEVFRLLKPGGVFGCQDWVMTSEYDASNPQHRRIKQDILRGNGLGDLNNISGVIQCIKDVGFEVVESKDFGEGSEIPWYQPLLPNWTTMTGFRSTTVGRFLTHVMLQGLEAVGKAPRGSVKVHKTLCDGADALINGGKANIFTTSFFVLCRKPHSQK